MTFWRFFVLSSFLTMLLTPSVLGQTWQERFAAVESLLKRGEADSAKSVLEQAVALAETQFTRSDSTIDIKFYRDGVSYRIYFRSFSEAEQLYARLVTISGKLYGPTNYKFALHSRRLGAVYVTLGRYREAVATYRRALSAAEHAFGADSKKTVGILNDLGDVLCLIAEYEEADSVAKRALSIGEDKPGPNHPSVARSLEIIGQVRMRHGAYTQADSVFRRSLKILKDKLGPDHPDVAACLGWRGFSCWKTGMVVEADTVLTRALQISEATFGPDHVEVAASLRHLAEYYYQCVWRHADAERIFDRAAAILEETYGIQHPQTALAILNLARAKIASTKFDDAKALALQTLPVLEQTLGPKHHAVASALTVTATTNRYASRLAEAKDLLGQAAAILEARGESFSPQMAGILRGLGTTCWESLLFAQADSAFRKALSIAETLSDSADYIYTATALSQFCLNNNMISEASSLCTKSLAIIENLYGGKHPLAVSHLFGLAVCAKHEGDSEKEEAFYSEALSTSQEIYGDDNANHAMALRLLAAFYYEQGNIEQAQFLFLEALAILDKVLGPDHSVSSSILETLAKTFGAQGKYDESLQYYGRLIRTTHKAIRAVFGSTSESKKVTYLRYYPTIIYDLLSLTLKHNIVQSRELALEMILKGKAIVEEAAMVERRAAYCNHDSTIAKQLVQLGEVRTEVANHVLSGSAEGKVLSDLYAVLDSLEVELSNKCYEFGRDLAMQNFKVADVASALPEDAILVEFLTNFLYDFDSLGYIVDDSSNYVNCLLGFTLDHAGKITMTDLGSANEIYDLISSARDLIYDAQSLMRSTKAAVAEERLREVTGRLYELVFAPLMAKFDGKTSLYISPDRILNLLPFEILPMPDSSYLIEKYRISYLSSGRDLLRYRQPAEISDNVVVIADPDFETASDRAIAVSSKLVAVTFPATDTLVHQARDNERCLDGPFGRLNHGLAEGKHVAESFQNLSSNRPVAEFYGPDASEANLKGMEGGPGVLHLATHGYFCNYSEGLPSAYESPLLRSGLLLAGCNRTIVGNPQTADGEDGILTAIEVSGLNLDGTELVMLSACESGIAEGYTSEGLYGLRRAFQHAGAQSVVMSLWKVPDRETRLLMEGFYDRWLSGSTKQDALRESALELLRNCREELGSGHPLLWGGFILTGNPN